MHGRPWLLHFQLYILQFSSRWQTRKALQEFLALFALAPAISVVLPLPLPLASRSRKINSDLRQRSCAELAAYLCLTTDDDSRLAVGQLQRRLELPIFWLCCDNCEGFFSCLLFLVHSYFVYMLVLCVC